MFIALLKPGRSVRPGPSRSILGLVALLLLAACEPVSQPKPVYRPGEAGTVDHALCLLGFSAVPVLAVKPGHQLIDATLNGQTGKFVLDTGANLTVVNAAHAESFGLVAGGAGGFLDGRAPPTGGSGSVRPVPIKSFEIGSITVRQSRIVTADLGKLLTALGRASGEDVAGIIGQDVLNEHRAIIDVARPMLYLMKDDRDPGPVPDHHCRPEDGLSTDKVR